MKHQYALLYADLSCNGVYFCRRDLNHLLINAVIIYYLHMLRSIVWLTVLFLVKETRAQLQFGFFDFFRGYHRPVFRGNRSRETPNCAKWNQYMNRCFECQQGYKQVHGKCQLKCGEREFLQNGNCVRVSDQCTKWLPKEGVCTECRLDSILIFGRCECASNEFLHNNKCIAVPDNCSEWTKKDGCTACKKPQDRVFDGICEERCDWVHPKGYCFLYEGPCFFYYKSQCQMCNYGKTLQNGQCP